MAAYFHRLGLLRRWLDNTGEALATILRPGNAGSNTLVDHIAVLRAALAQLPGGHTRGKKVLIRVEGVDGTMSCSPG